MKPLCNCIARVFCRGAFLFALLFSALSCFSQIQFHRLYARNDTVGPSALGGVAELPGEGYLFTGSILPCFNCTLSDALAFKTNLIGDTVWTRRIGGSRADGFGYTIVTVDGNYLFAGTSMSFGPQPMASSQLYGNYIYLLKMTPNGDTLWTKIYGGTNTDYYHDNNLETVKQTADGGFVLTGTVKDLTNSNKLDGFVIRLNPNGDTLWTKVYGSANWEAVHNITETQDGGFVLAADTGWTQGMLYTSEGHIVKIDSAGNIQWQRTYGGSQLDALRGVEQLSTGDFLVVGQTNSFTNDSTKEYIYALRLNSAGDTIWTRIYGPVYSFTDLNLLNDSIAMISGFAGTSHGGLLVMKIRTQDGSIISTKEYGTLGSVYGVTPTADGGFIFGSDSPLFGSSYGEGYVIKADGNGNSGCYEYAITENSLPTQTQVGQGHLKIKPFPVLVQSTQTQVSSGIKIGTVCTNAGVSEAEKKSNISVYPNPCAGVLNVSQTGPGGIISMENTLGEQLLTIRQSKTIEQIQLSEFPNGAYILKVHTPGHLSAFKIIVQH